MRKHRNERGLPEQVADRNQSRTAMLQRLGLQREPVPEPEPVLSEDWWLNWVNSYLVESSARASRALEEFARSVAGLAESLGRSFSATFGVVDEVSESVAVAGQATLTVPMTPFQPSDPRHQPLERVSSEFVGVTSEFVRCSFGPEEHPRFMYDSVHHEPGRRGLTVSLYDGLSWPDEGYPCQVCWSVARWPWEPARACPWNVDPETTYCDRHREQFGLPRRTLSVQQASELIEREEQARSHVPVHPSSAPSRVVDRDTYNSVLQARVQGHGVHLFLGGTLDGQTRGVIQTDGRFPETYHVPVYRSSVASYRRLEGETEPTALGYQVEVYERRYLERRTFLEGTAVEGAYAYVYTGTRGSAQ